MNYKKKDLNLQLPAPLLFVGSTKTGKSYLLKSILLKYVNFFNYGLVISPTEKFNNQYDYIDNKFIHYKYSDQLIISLINKQEEFIELAKKNKKMKIPECFLILDDCLGEVNMRSQNNMIDILFSKGRHYHITLFLTTQKITYVSPTIRENAKYVFITKVTKSSYEKLYELSDDFSNYKEFAAYLDKQCVDYRVVFFDHMDAYAKSHVGIIKAPEKMPNFKISF